jgi:glycosyltransferase involved in cell wall biosynthesis
MASALRQTYEHLEVLVVGDHCDPATEAAVLGVKDPRVRFVNLAERGVYPTDPYRRWMVAGAAPMNAALAIAQGAWIAPCDDDDELTDDHVEVLLATARQRRLEFVWSKARMEIESGEWREAGGPDLARDGTTHGSVFYASQLRFFRYNDNAWMLGQPGDWNMWQRMQRAGVRMGFVDQVTYVHYLEAHQRG